MKVLFCGTQDWQDPLPIYKELAHLLGNYGEELLVVHGTSPGADAITARITADMGIPTTVIAPNLRGVDLVVAYRAHEEAPQTNHLIGLAIKKGLRVILWLPRTGSQLLSLGKRKVKPVSTLTPTQSKAAKTLLPHAYTFPEAQNVVAVWFGISRTEINDELDEAKYDLGEADDVWRQTSTLPEPYDADQAMAMVVAWEERDKARARVARWEEKLEIFDRSVDHLMTHGFLKLDPILAVTGNGK